MTWFNIEITEACVLGGAYHRLCRQFQQAFIAAGAPADMALFAQTVILDDTRNIYLSPASFSYVRPLIESYGGAPCERPSMQDVILVFGVPDAPAHLLESEEDDRESLLEHSSTLLNSSARPMRAQQAMSTS